MDSDKKQHTNAIYLNLKTLNLYIQLLNCTKQGGSITTKDTAGNLNNFPSTLASNNFYKKINKLLY